MGPTFDNEPLDDYIYSPLHDRYFTPEQLDHAALLEADEMESREVQQRIHMLRCGSAPMGLPEDPLSAARGDSNASFEPITTPSQAVTQPVRDLVQFDGGIVVLAEVNPVSGLEQVCSLDVLPISLSLVLVHRICHVRGSCRPERSR